MIEAEYGVELIVSGVYKGDPLSVVSLAYQELQLLLATNTQGTESYRNSEFRFAAQSEKFNALRSSAALSAPITAIFMLGNAQVDSAQRI